MVVARAQVLVQHEVEVIGRHADVARCIDGLRGQLVSAVFQRRIGLEGPTACAVDRRTAQFHAVAIDDDRAVRFGLAADRWRGVVGDAARNHGAVVRALVVEDAFDGRCKRRLGVHREIERFGRRAGNAILAHGGGGQAVSTVRQKHR
ncbi:hypothetical protein D3C86_1110040 [compost metagenome]